MVLVGTVSVKGKTMAETTKLVPSLLICVM